MACDRLCGELLFLGADGIVRAPPVALAPGLSGGWQAGRDG